MANDRLLNIVFALKNRPRPPLSPQVEMERAIKMNFECKCALTLVQCSQLMNDMHTFRPRDQKVDRQCKHVTLILWTVTGELDIIPSNNAHHK